MYCADFDVLSQLDEVNEIEFLLQNIHAFVNAYQETGASMFAWMVHRAADDVCQHPDYEGTDEERCGYRKMSRQWKMLALSSEGIWGGAK